ncbi:MarR family winged helix-turn-helix transcriptional regulator [Kitasatospora sp. NPDC098652]|uniref:MarR family winged helix-turn-helix transcriptional regulator n=1 Tax=Kitasatospora sp. NPDC098652 TaxID=3364095 RepID=UPI00381E8B75
MRPAPNTVSGLLTRLMAAGLVDRGTDPRDRRRTVVQLTDEGHDHLTTWQHVKERRIGAAVDALDPGERTALTSALPAMNSLVHRLHRGSPHIRPTGPPDAQPRLARHRPKARPRPPVPP